jgi:hypothetical protein
MEFLMPQNPASPPLRCLSQSSLHLFLLVELVLMRSLMIDLHSGLFQLTIGEYLAFELFRGNNGNILCKNLQPVVRYR